MTIRRKYCPLSNVCFLGGIAGIENVDTYHRYQKTEKEFQAGNRPDVLIMDICHEFNPALPKTKERQEELTMRMS